MYRATVQNNANGTEEEYVGMTDLAVKTPNNIASGIKQKSEPKPEQCDLCLSKKKVYILQHLNKPRNPIKRTDIGNKKRKPSNSSTILDHNLAPGRRP